ncbi:MAG TPA: hypothetical protein VH309_09890 [Elusimicrobiota bacterium]|jgi:hypothetical protein|nr:hypothetical protein [Elusimicrobiota bacterium]
MTATTTFRARLAPFMPALLLAASGCVYSVAPAPAPDLKPFPTSLPLRVAVSGEAADKGTDQRVQLKPSNALVTALLHTGLFRDVRSEAGGGGFDLVVQLDGKQDRTMHSFFPFFLPFCDPMIIGCLPFYPITDHFTAEMTATVSGGKTYSETGLADLNCEGPCGCAPASQGDPLARASALENAAAKLAEDFVKDADYYRGLARAAAARQSAADDEAAAAPEPSAAADADAPAAPAATAAPAAGGSKPWWQQ